MHANSSSKVFAFTGRSNFILHLLSGESVGLKEERLTKLSSMSQVVEETE